MEGATFTLLAGMQRMKDYGLAATELRVVGGGSQNKLWRRIVADAFQLPLRFPAEPEAAALGAALQVGSNALLPQALWNNGSWWCLVKRSGHTGRHCTPVSC